MPESCQRQRKRDVEDASQVCRAEVYRANAIDSGLHAVRARLFRQHRGIWEQYLVLLERERAVGLSWDATIVDDATAVASAIYII